jgi:hypothetical protein
MQIHGPERLAGQGLDREQQESGNRAIAALLGDSRIAAQMDLVLTWRAGQGDAPGAYEIWSARGMVRFQRVLGDDGCLDYRVIEVVGENPVANQDPDALASLEAECAAARASGFEAEDPARRFIAPQQQSYPFAYERVAQLFDSPNAPDLAISPRDWCQGLQPATHGALHVRQSRAPLWFSGPGVRAGEHALAARAVDIAPTCLAALGFPPVDGADASGRRASERGVAPDVLLARQDGRILEEILQETANPPKRLYIFLLDGLHQTELARRLDGDPAALPNLRRLREGAAVLGSGSIVNFPSITWPSHTAIGTGTWCGHHDVVNPTYYLREKRESVSPQGQQVRTEGFASSAVESLAEAFHRVRGPDCMTAAIHAPFGRSAKHAVLEGRNLGDRPRLKALTQELAADQHRRWKQDGFDGIEQESVLDTRGIAQLIDLYTREDLPPPEFVYHELVLTDGVGHDYGPHSEGLEDALDETDRRVGRVLDLLEQVGLREETLFVVTADHGMAPQDVSLEANPAWHVIDAGLEAFVAEPMIWLRDLAVHVERAPDGRSARVFVFENDALPSGERPALEGAEVLIEVHRDAGAQELTRGRTGPGGVYGFATPSDIPSNHIALAIRAPKRNPRHLLLDGTPLALDLRRALYGK